MIARARRFVHHRPQVAAGAVLLVIYLATLAPSVTFWDAGEFVAAGATLGIPHPPGTPLYVMLLRSAVVLLPFDDPAVATNMLSAIAAAAACASLAALLRPGIGTTATVAAGIASGVMASIWVNATETEVYGVSLALVAATLLAADRAGRTGEVRWLGLVAYLTVLAVPLHLSALLAGPAVLWLASTGGERVRWGDGIALAGAFVTAVGVGRASLLLTAAGATIVAGGAAVCWWSARSNAAVRTTLALLLLCALAATALLFLAVRASHDPLLNQGNPDSWTALADVIARRQYAVSPMWPRSAPLWLQLGNFFQYVDWQVALTLAPTVIPTAPRVIATILFVTLALYGSLQHRSADRRRWWMLVILLACGSVGAVLYLNMRASPSFGWGILPANAVREARERDYFFILAFWVWGAWIGVGAVALARRLRKPAWAGLAIVALPVVLNWRSVDRRREPEASLPLAMAEALLDQAPPRAVLFLDGDNDTYPVWYAQVARGRRPDVTPVTVPLLPAGWYRAEIARRHGLLTDGGRRWIGHEPTWRQIAQLARDSARPVVAVVTLRGSTRRAISDSWVLRGALLHEALAGPGDVRFREFAVDTAEARRHVKRVVARTRGRQPSPSTDPVARWAVATLACSQWATDSAAASPPEAPISLDSLCKLR